MYATRRLPVASLSSTLCSPDRSRREPRPQGFCEGVECVVLVYQEKDTERGTLTRRISSLREVGEHYRRDDEVRRQRLYESSEIAGEKCGVSFRVRTMRSYGR